MSKTMRLLLFLLFAILGGIFLYPTIRWHFFTDAEQKELVNSSRDVIREWSEERSREDLDEILSWVVDGEVRDGPVPEQYDFLRKAAESNYKLTGKPLPETWDRKAVLEGFLNQRELTDILEEHYREVILGIKDLRDRSIVLGLDLAGGMSVLLEPDFNKLEEQQDNVILSDAEKNDVVDVSMEILNERIDQFGVTEPQIRKQADNTILIEVPGEPDPDRIENFLVGKGSLAFHIVDDQGTAAVQTYARGGGSIVDGRPEEDGVLDAGLLALGYYKRDLYGVDQFQWWIVVNQEPGLDGSHIQEAATITDPNFLRPLTTFTLDSSGATAFGKLTAENVGNQMAVVLEDKIKAYATITEEISGGRVSVSGLTSEEARNLATVLRTASMPVDLDVKSLQQVGPTLGRLTITSGLKAILYGFLAVLVFMALWYKGAGLIADFALIVNLFLLTAIMSSFNFTLTMTSIAGLILTVGISVDANVIIFERIKEELRLGKSRSAAVDSGFKKAFWTILDAQITTLIAAVFLSLLAKGPIQGFAFTLAAGIVCSLFSSLFFSRLLFDFGTETLKREKISIMWRTS